MEKIIQVKENFRNTFQNHKDFLGCGVGKMFGDDVLHLYVRNYDCNLVDTILRKGSRFEGMPVRIFETGEIKAL